MESAQHVISFVSHAVRVVAYILAICLTSTLFDTVVGGGGYSHFDISAFPRYIIKKKNLQNRPTVLDITIYKQTDR